MDGTLLNSQNKISQENIEAVKKAQLKGIEVVIATGRAYFDAAQLTKEAGLSTWIIGANGATIHNKEGVCLQSISVSKKDAKEILAYFTEKEFYYEVFSEHKLFSPNNGRELVQIELDRITTANPDSNIEEMKEAAERQFSQEPFKFVHSYEEILAETDKYFNLLAFSFDDNKLKQAWNRFAKNDHLTLTASASHVFDIMHCDVSKGNAVKKLAQKFNVKPKDIMAVGDNFNDISMFTVAGTSIAMGNAPDGVKKQAMVTTLTNNENGVAYSINKVINGQ